MHADDTGVAAGVAVDSAGPASCLSRVRAHLTARSLVSTTAKRQNSMPVQATTPARRGRGGRVGLHQRFGQQVVEPVLGHPGQDEVLVGANPHRAVAVGLGQAGRLDQIDPVHPPDRHRAADVEETRPASGGAHRRGRLGNGRSAPGRPGPGRSGCARPAPPGIPRDRALGPGSACGPGRGSPGSQARRRTGRPPGTTRPPGPGV